MTALLSSRLRAAILVMASLAASLPAPAAAQQPARANSARPIGSPAEWLDPEDYPQQAILESAEGVTEARLEIDADGLVRKCTVTSSSGFAVLDETACLRLRQRGVFEPARNAAGERIGGSWSTRVVWQMPEDKRMPFPGRARVEFVMDIDADGNIADCEIVSMELPRGAPAESPCAAPQQYFPFEDAQGNRVAKRVRFRFETTYEDFQP
ncbi:TonB family protein [Aurantiacibacter spongiae]|uniref:TonB family protein n=1 Tax=Aurantiacibacter spongiae TaxID=2488860 RepID=A0A3N5CY36_9SPHN|nr:TonB family protein [Aurantiacibacter spongiae]RPF72560.1 TonB family protein [Aurantiacibacter spongiae]